MGADQSKRRIIIDFAIALGLVTLIVVARLIPHLPNFTPVSAVALFSAYYFRHRQWASVIPLVGMIMADFFLPQYAWEQRLVVYGSFFVCYLIGMILRKKYTLGRTMGVSLLASLAFFLITNCVFLYQGPGPVMYSHTIAGQLESYVNALPFLKWTVLGDLAYSLVIFGAYQYAHTFAINKNKRKVALDERAQ